LSQSILKNTARCMCFNARRHGDSYQQNTNDTKSELTGFLSMDGSDFTDKMGPGSQPSLRDYGRSNVKPQP
jgi:hypothetical protein